MVAAWTGGAGRGEARRGEAWHGAARRGEAWQGFLKLIIRESPQRRRLQRTAERVQLHRRRKRCGLIVLPIEMDFGAVGDLLVASGFLREWDAGSREALRAALERALDFWAQA